MHFNTQVLNKKKKKRKTISIAYDCQKFAKRTTWSHLNRNASDSTYHKKQQKFEPKFFHEYFNRSNLWSNDSSNIYRVRPSPTFHRAPIVQPAFRIRSLIYSSSPAHARKERNHRRKRKVKKERKEKIKWRKRNKRRTRNGGAKEKKAYTHTHTRDQDG